MVQTILNPLEQGRVIAAHGRHFIVAMADDHPRHCFPRGKKTGPTVGDHVLVRLQGAHEGTIERILPRRNLLYRSDAQRSKQFAANIDLLLLVLAVAPPFSQELLHRALVAAACADIPALVILNKSDLADGLPAARQQLQSVQDLGVRVLESSALDPAATRAQLLPELHGRTALLLGQSAMGKSTLLNALVPDAHAHTQDYSRALGAGKHTTTSTRLYAIEGGGALIDSPGFQSFGLMHLSPGEIERGFPEFASPRQQCRFYNCTHRQEPGCGVLAAVDRGEIAPQRHALYVRLLDEAGDAAHNARR